MSTQPPPSKPPPPLTSSPYPFAAAPDIIRAHQKDAYFQGVLTNQLSDLYRRLRGARSAHAWATEIRTFADALYLCLTTLIGNRTLGEEYCDLVQVEAPSHPIFPPTKPPSQPPSNDTNATAEQIVGGGEGGPYLPTISRRAGYILTSVLLPYLAHRTLPSFRSLLRNLIRARLATLTRQGRDEARDKSGRPSAEYRVLRYLLTHLVPLTSGAHIRAIALAAFYFTGAYYELSKRVWGLRYVFTTRKAVEGHPAGQVGAGRGGYEVLGVLLVVQMLVRGWMHIRRELSSANKAGAVNPDAEEEDEDGGMYTHRGMFGPAVDVSLDENMYTSNNELLDGQGDAAGNSGQRSLAEIGAMAHTPVPKAGRARYDLAQGKDVMGWMKGDQQRKCTLCLEEMKDPAATQCGHVFCWACIGDWVREKPECPLCRRGVMAQHILPLRSI
jgi:peroxin-10